MPENLLWAASWRALLGLERQPLPRSRHVDENGLDSKALLAISHLPIFGSTLPALRGADHGSSPLLPFDPTSYHATSARWPTERGLFGRLRQFCYISGADPPRACSGAAARFRPESPSQTHKGGAAARSGPFVRNQAERPSTSPRRPKPTSRHVEFRSKSGKPGNPASGFPVYLSLRGNRPPVIRGDVSIPTSGGR